MRRRALAVTALSISLLVLGLVELASAASIQVGDALLGWPAAVLAVSAIISAILLRRPRVPIAAVWGTLSGLLLLLYSGWLIDPRPTDVPERGNLLFTLALLGLWAVTTAARIPVGRKLGLIGGLALFGTIPATFALGSPPTDTVLRLMTAVAGVGCLISGAWAAGVGRHVRATSGRASGASQAQAPGPPTLAWPWAVPLPNRVPVLLQVAGAAAIGDGLLRLTTSPAVVATTPLEIAEAVFGVSWLLFVVALRRAAPRVGAITSPAVALWELLIPVGIGFTSLVGVLVLIPPTEALQVDQMSPLELSNAAPIFVALAAARIAWVTRVMGRLIGLTVAAIWFLGGIAAVGVASGQPLPAFALVGAAAAGIAWIVAGLWILGLGGRLRGQRPVDAFLRPRGTLPVIDPRVEPKPKPEPAAGREARDVRPARVRLVPNRPASSELRFRKVHTRSRLSVAVLATRLGLTIGELQAARPGYHTFTIPKRSGGIRTITAPDPGTKATQRRILRRLLARLPAHDTAHGFERGRSIVTNASAHPSPAVLVKLDIEDFFGATRTARIRRYWRVLGWDRECARILTRLTTWEGGLPQGAPTSPRLANLVNVRLDARLAGLAAVHGATYTRYADDLTFSFAADRGEAVRDLIHAVQRVCRNEGRYRLHFRRKVEIRRRYERQAITGLIVNDGRPRLSRERRRWLRAVEYRRYSGRTPTIDDESLRGWHALESMIDQQVRPADEAAEPS